MFIKPVVWFPMLVRHRDDKNMVLVYSVEQLVWKLVQETFSYTATCYGPAFRVRGNSERGLSYLFLESCVQALNIRVRRTEQHLPVPASRAW